MYKLKLEPTAALVMQWAKNLYNEGIVLQYINQLDLSSGDELLLKCNTVCEWYGEVILNRKYFLKHLVEEQLNTSTNQYQLIVLAAGKSPLALEILQKNFDKVNFIYEIDIAWMAEKKNLYQKIAPDFFKKINCITADITSNKIINILNKENGYNSNIPSIIILEGISYYISKHELKDILVNFESENKKNLFIIEYMVPEKNVAQKRKFIPGEVFKIIQGDSGLDEINCYTKNEFKKL